MQTPTGMWLPYVDFHEGRGVSDQLLGETMTSLAQTGTNFLEYGRLSERTGEEDYLNNVHSILKKSHSRLPKHGGH